MYLTDDNRINSTKWEIPVMGFIDMQNVSDDNLCNLNYEVRNILVKPNSTEEHSIYVEVELEIMCEVYENKELNIIQDLYSPSENLNVNQKSVTVMQDKQNIKDTCTIKEKTTIPEFSNSKIYKMEAIPRIVKENIYNDRIMYDGELEIKFMYISGITNRLDIKTQIIPFSKSVEAQGVSVTSNVETQIDILNQNFDVMSDGGIEINVELEINSDISKMKEVKVIDNLEI